MNGGSIYLFVFILSMKQKIILGNCKYTLRALDNKTKIKNMVN